MSKQLFLTLAYLEHAPQAAAQILQKFKVEEIVAFLESVPTRLSAPVINSMIPWGAARCLELLTPSKAAAILHSIPFHESTSLMRLVDSKEHQTILEELPVIFSKRLRNSLQYPLSQVGAWVDPTIPILSTDDTVQHALNFLQESASANHVFLESASNGQFIGVISIKNLLRSDSTMRLSQLPINNIDPVSNRATIRSVSFDARWDNFLYLPVVGRRGAILGGLSRGALRNQEYQQVVSQDQYSKTLFGYLLDALFTTSAGILKIIFDNKRVNSIEIRRDHEHTS